MVHALVTGPGISGRIPIEHERHPEGFVDVTDYAIYSDDPDHIQAIAAAIEEEHFVRGTHPAQLALKALDDQEQFPDGVTEEHREQAHATYREVQERINSRSARGER
jgi:hypothetical protein